MGNNADKEKKLALALLHGAIGAKKKGNLWTKAYEQLMKRHLELCVDLKDHRMAKDGLHQYRNLCQSVCYIETKHFCRPSIKVYYHYIAVARLIQILLRPLSFISWSYRKQEQQLPVKKQIE